MAGGRPLRGRRNLMLRHEAQAEDPELFAALQEKKSRESSPILPIEDKSRCRMKFRTCRGTCSGCSKPIESNKRAIMERLLADWEAMPDLRLGQFLSNAVEYAKTEYHSPDLFYIQDDELVDAARKYRRR